jgi:hypothetical protein
MIVNGLSLLVKWDRETLTQTWLESIQSASVLLLADLKFGKMDGFGKRAAIRRSMPALASKGTLDLCLTS